MTGSEHSLLPDDEMNRLVFLEFIDESLDALQDLDHRLVELEHHPDDLSAVNAIFRPIHSIKGNSAFFGMLKVKKLAHELENILDDLRKGLCALDAPRMNVLLRGFDELRAIFTRVREDGPEVINLSAFQSLLRDVEENRSEAQAAGGNWPRLVMELDRLMRKVRPAHKDVVDEVERLISSLKNQIQESGTVPAPSEESEAVETEISDDHPDLTAIAHPRVDEPTGVSTSPQRQKTLRIGEAQLDTFLAYVGELLVVGEMFTHLQNHIANQTKNSALLTEFRYVNETFSDLSRDLQKGIMAIRQVPLKPLLDKSIRMIRDIASASGKDISTEVLDHGISADKSIVDLLDSPLTHLFRNAADHGIELPDVREAAGKSRQGVIQIEARESDQQLIIEIRDDGAGLNFAALQAKGRALGLLATDRDATENELIEVLFASGVSTQETVTDVSGRGVGMDVVRRTIEESGGHIDVETTVGKGSCFRVTLPKSVTTQILAGFLVEAGGITFVLPMEQIRETAQIKSADIHWVKGRGQCVQRHGSILPVRSLREILNLPPKESHAEDERITLLMVDLGYCHQALIVDQLVGVQQVVVKPIDGLEGLLEGIAGGALMGSGHVALVLELGALIRPMNA